MALFLNPNTWAIFRKPILFSIEYPCQIGIGAMHGYWIIGHNEVVPIIYFRIDRKSKLEQFS